MPALWPRNTDCRVGSSALIPSTACQRGGQPLQPSQRGTPLSPYCFIIGTREGGAGPTPVRDRPCARRGVGRSRLGAGRASGGLGPARPRRQAGRPPEVRSSGASSGRTGEAGWGFGRGGGALTGGNGRSRGLSGAVGGFSGNLRFRNWALGALGERQGCGLLSFLSFYNSVDNTNVTMYHLISQAGWNRCNLSIHGTRPLLACLAEGCAACRQACVSAAAPPPRQRCSQQVLD